MSSKNSIVAVHLLLILHSWIGVSTRYLMIHLHSKKEITAYGYRTDLSGKFSHNYDIKSETFCFP